MTSTSCYIYLKNLIETIFCQIILKKVMASISPSTLKIDNVGFFSVRQKKIDNERQVKRIYSEEKNVVLDHMTDWFLV